MDERTGAPPATPDHHNWRQFCQEPPLTEEEQERWNQADAVMRDNPDCFDYVIVVTEAEFKATIQINPVKDGWWDDLVKYTDAERVLKRAEIRAVAAWKRQASEER